MESGFDPFDAESAGRFEDHQENDFLGESSPSVLSLIGYGALLGLVKLAEGLYRLRARAARSNRAEDRVAHVEKT